MNMNKLTLSKKIVIKSHLILKKISMNFTLYSLNQLIHRSCFKQL